ncbi:hypothetical protein CR970_00485 [Candidatus Saccharibacteria bacterium]|nr:MAG: hypothetical protein CR970_00485 [Candidatus Saccharibacteria bacterium]
MAVMDIVIRLAADGLLVVVAGIAFYSFCCVVPKRQWRAWAVRIVLAGLTAYAAAKFAGWLYQPETMRPFEQLGVEPGAAYLPNPGFPSDHALFASFLTLAVWFSTQRKDLAIVMAVLTLTLSLARVVALVHTPVDVLGGLTLAVVGIIWYRRPLKNVVK